MMKRIKHTNKCILVGALLLILLGCKNKNDHEGKLHIEESVMVDKVIIDSLNLEAKSFILSIIQHYNYLLDSLIETQHHSIFILSDNKKFEITIILSNSYESIITVDTAKKNTINTYFTEYPSQLYLFSKGYIADKRHNEMSLEAVKDTFYLENAAIKIGFFELGFYSSSSYTGPLGKIFDLYGSQNILIIKDAHFKIFVDQNNAIFDEKIYLGFLNNVGNFSWISDFSSDYAEFLFKKEFIENYTTSELFKNSFLINQYLKDDVKEIIEIESQLKEGNNNIAIEVILDKYNKLNQKAQNLGFDTDKLEIIKKSFQPNDHFFLINHKSSKHYMWFWIFSNIIFIVVYLLLFFIVLQLKSLRKLLDKIGFKLTGIVVFGFLNYEIYANTPEYYPLKFMIIPLIVYFALCIVIAILKLKRYDKNNIQRSV